MQNNLIKSVRNKSRAYSTRAYAQYTLGDLRGAKGDCDASSAINEQDYLEHFVTGLLQRKSHCDKNALEELTKSIELNPAFSESIAERGELLCSSGETTLRRKQILQVLTACPNSARNMTNLGSRS